MILMIDNYDSFTYNLVQYLKQIGPEVFVARNDKISIQEIENMQPKGIVISPGPGRPESAGVSLETIRTFSGRIPLLGVCLGHQSIAEAFGGKVILAQRVMHGKTSTIKGDGKMIYEGIDKPFQAMRYHSLAVSRDHLPDCFEITAESDDGEIMGIRHKTHMTEGIQFHPESIMTPLGKRMLRNFIKMAGL
ncbi:MAG: aminodeoxychorismate/anthranilate synthase component II [Desulfobacteraceae bacterium]|nr:aminodeoxychorismate/anthranilate synthase component II [Desulfobacteraceae bacterium]MBU4002493.1 aminodeoxychorismate/anthranilate synthase component II [Pseudomonadota bacterium]MBU4052962.1 aminodeoxychorismate/anthranilate synthase component II [Pseudomonadota bacterium]